VAMKELVPALPEEEVVDLRVGPIGEELAPHLGQCKLSLTQASVKTLAFWERLLY